MSSIEEYKVRALLEESKYLWTNKDLDQTYPQKARNLFDEADLLVRSNPSKFSLQLLVLIAETATTLETRNTVGKRYVDLFFQRPPSNDQFHIKALLLNAEFLSLQVYSENLKGQQAVDQTRQAYTFIQEAIDTINKPENKPRYQFLIYNASVSAWKILRPMVRQGYAKHFVDCFEKLSNSLEETDDVDTEWRVRFMQALANCYLDAERKADAAKALDKVWDLMKKKGNVSFLEAIWRTKVHFNKDNSGAVSSLKKEAEASKSDLRFSVPMQQIRSCGLPDNQVEKELNSFLQSKPNSEGLAEASRVALQYNLIDLSKKALSYFDSTRQPSLKARIWAEYSKAELLVKDHSEMKHPVTGLKPSPAEQKSIELEYRIKALKQLDRTMVANKRLQDPSVTTEGCVLIWNIGKPLLTPSLRDNVYRPFQTAASFLETIESPMHDLRLFLHLELARYELQEDFIAKAEAQLSKASLLDWTNFKPALQASEKENPSHLHRPYEKLQEFLNFKLELKKSVYQEPNRNFKKAWLELENAKSVKSQAAKENILERALENLKQEEELPNSDPEDLVEEEINFREKQREHTLYSELKIRHTLASQVASVALESGLLKLAKLAAEFVIAGEWDPSKERELVSEQASCHYIIAQVKAAEIKQVGLEVCFNEAVTIGSIHSVSESNQSKELKTQVLLHIKTGVDLGNQASQPWVCFNGAVVFWNLYLPVLQLVQFEKHILKEALDCMRQLFETLLSSIEKQTLTETQVTQVAFNKTTDFNYPKKLQIICDLAIALVKLEIYENKVEEAAKVCESLLNKPIGPNNRKELERLKGACTAIKAPQQKAPQKASEGITAEVLSLMEGAKLMMKETGKHNLCVDSLKKANTLLNGWTVNESEESELQLHAELWSKLGRQTIKLKELAKLALACAQRALKYSETGSLSKTRICWYSVAEYLYGEALLCLIDKEKQEQDSQNKLILSALEHLIRSAEYGLRTGINKLVLDSARAVFNFCVEFESSAMLVAPLSDMANILVHLRDSSDQDFLLAFYKALIDCITKAEMWSEGERLMDSAFEIVASSHSKALGEAQMLFLSKQGKNVYNFLVRLKESDPVMQSKLWLKLARSSVDSQEINSAYEKALDCLKNHIESSEVLIEWASYLNSKGEDVSDKLVQASEVLLEVERHEESSLTSSRHSEGIKSKRSIESKPDKLNVTHLDRLLRIKVMLSQLSKSTQAKINLGKEAVGFVKRIIEMSGIELPEDLMNFTIEEAELESYQQKDKLCRVAFEKPKLTHYYSKELLLLLDESFSCYWDSLLVVNFLELYSKVVLKSKAYTEIYSSWKSRIKKKIDLSSELSEVSFGELNSQERLDMACELYKRADYTLAEELLSQTTGGLLLKAGISFIGGRLKESIFLYQEALRVKSLESLKCLSSVSSCLYFAGKTQDALNLLESSIEALPSELPYAFIKESLHIKLAHLSLLQSKNPTLTSSEKQNLKQKSQKNLNHFILSIQSEGCEIKHIYEYLEFHQEKVLAIKNSLLSDFCKEKALKQKNKLEELKKALETVNGVCTDYIDLSESYKTEGKSLVALIYLKLGEVLLLKFKLQKELLERRSTQDLVQKYLEDIEIQIEQQELATKNPIDIAFSYLEEAQKLVSEASPVKSKIEKTLLEAQSLKGDLPEFFSSEKTPEELICELNTYQHKTARKYFLEQFKTYSKPWQKEKLLLELKNKQSVVMPSSHNWEEQFSGNFWELTEWKLDLEDLKEKLSPSTGVLAIQYSQDMGYVYSGFVKLDRDKASSFWTEKRKVTCEEQQKIRSLLETWKQFKTLTGKTIIMDQQARQQYLAEANLKLNEAVSQLQEVTTWLSPLADYIVQEPEQSQEETKKKPTKAKQEDKLAELLTQTNSSIATLYLCLDYRLIDLPWEATDFISPVPIVSREFSVSCLHFRLLKVPSVPKEPVRYNITEGDNLLKQFAKLEGGRGAKGGEWEALCNGASVLINYGEPVDNSAVTALVSKSVAKAMLEVVSKRTQTKTQVLMGMLGVGVFVHNFCTVSQESALAYVEELWKLVSGGATFGVAFAKLKNDYEDNILKHAFHLYGVASLKLG